MLSSINPVKCLIVEDDPFKMERIREHLKSYFKSELQTFECQALDSAKKIIAQHSFDLAILDMSIHSHEPEAGAGSPLPEFGGGLEILFEIVHARIKAPCIILTQYPDIPVESVPVPVDMAKQEIFEKFGIEVAGCVRYYENDDGWKVEINKILEDV